MDPSNVLPGFSFTSDAPKAALICRNLRNYLFPMTSFNEQNCGDYFLSHNLLSCAGSLLSHAESLIPNFLNEEDVQLLR